MRALAAAYKVEREYNRDRERVLYLVAVSLETAD